MLNPVFLALLLSVAAQKDADKIIPPERPIFGFPTENSVLNSPAAATVQSNVSAVTKFSESFHNDARLMDVCFIDNQFGWAVGDRGVIWHTQDGGRQWRMQSSGVNCSLNSVCFINRQFGWAAGGSAKPYSHTSSGVILSTRDGGQTWTGNPRLFLPELKRILFTDLEHGWAIGFPSAMYPSGAFTSNDGGRSWNPLVGSCNSAWLSGDFLASSSGALAGCHATVAMANNGRLEPVSIDDSGLKNLRGLRLVPPLYGWLVGDGGLVRLTVKAGRDWNSPSGGSPAKSPRDFDFSALAAHGPKAWIAGSPGSRVFYTPDAGNTWESFATGVSIPLTAITFIDDQHGWAVGALGTILATTDGGRTWLRQRSGGSRVAVLCLLAQADDVPLELLAKLSGNDGYLSAVEVLARRDIEIRSNTSSPLPERLHQAVVAVGGSHADMAWQFPLRQSGIQSTAQHYCRNLSNAVPNDQDKNARESSHPLGEGLNATFPLPLGERLGVRALVVSKNQFSLDMAELDEHLVRQIRVWRPDIIITNDANARDDDQLNRLIGHAVLKAVDNAADPNSYPDQLSTSGLIAWKVKKVYAAMASDARGAIDLTTSQFLQRMGRSLADVAAEPHGLISNAFYFAPVNQAFSCLSDVAPDNQQQRDMMSGLTLPPGGDARRESSNAPLENIENLQRAALKQRNTQAILEQARRNPAAETQLLAQCNELTRGLDDDCAGRILYYLADRYSRTARWSLAAETFQLLADRYPQHPLTQPALLWLVQYYASGEAAWREQSTRQTPSPQAAPPALDVSKLESRWARAAALGKLIERTRPELYAEPALRFPLAVVWRNQNATRPAEQFYSAHSRAADRNPWSLCAQGEIALADSKIKQPKPTQRCWHSQSKPKLDGLLDDAVWKKIESAPLKSTFNDDEQWPAVAAFACDAEFLYIAVSCARLPGVNYEPTTAPRPRDADLTSQDRVDILIDIDRDFATYYRLSVDYRGFTADSLWADKTWDPTWYVTSNLTDEAWTVEAAVPLDQLTARAPKPQDAWAVGVQRTIPGVGFQSWSTPASTSIIPEGFGYLIFD